MVNRIMQELSPLQVSVLGVLGDSSGGIEEIKDLAGLVKATGKPKEKIERACDGMVAGGYIRCASSFDGDALLWYWITDFGRRQLDTMLRRGTEPTNPG